MFAVDVGGTFTDVVAIRDGRIEVTKVPSDPSRPEQPVVEGARRLGVEGSPVFNHASTMGLNAVITRRLPKIGFLTTEGHRDMLDRGRVWRPLDAQTDPAWRRPFGDAARPLVPRYLRRGVHERILADGSVLWPLDEEQARRQLAVLARCDVQGVAVCLLNSYVDSAHEERLRELAREVLGDVAISLSSEVSPLAKEYARASTAVVDVLMKLIFTGYAEQLDRDLRGLGFDGALNFADCAATLLPWNEALEKPFRIVFAGPAAGTVSSTRLGEALGEGNLLCCDVGGTSTDISLVAGGRPFVDNTFELEHDLIINALSTEISSVGAGGGSIVSISPSGDVLVGPGSAGADPGPACYGRGGEAPTLTDACLLMGILDPDGFAGGELRLDSDLARRAFESLDTPLRLDQRIAFAFRIAVANIAEEVLNVAIRHGVDPRDFTLVAYGAAGPMLLPAALELLRVKRLVVPPHPGLFSALGLLSTDLVYYDSRSAYVVLSPETAPMISIGLRGHGAAAARQGRHREERRRRPAQLRRAPHGAELGDAVRRGARGADHGGDDSRPDRPLPRRVRAALRESLRVRAGPGRQLPRASSSSRPRRSSTGPSRSAPRLEPEPDRRLELRHLADGPLLPASTSANDSLPAPAYVARRSSARPSPQRSSARVRRQRSAPLASS